MKSQIPETKFCALNAILISLILETGNLLNKHSSELLNNCLNMTNVFNKYDSIIIGTGNILENEEFKKAKNPTQEVKTYVFPKDKNFVIKMFYVSSPAHSRLFHVFLRC